MKPSDYKFYVELTYNNKTYKLDVTDDFPPYWDEDHEDWNWFWWEDGNGGCDCCRSYMINKSFPDFPKFEHCGHTIELEGCWEELIEKQ